jgi:hypothetical protein
VPNQVDGSGFPTAARFSVKEANIRFSFKGCETASQAKLMATLKSEIEAVVIFVNGMLCDFFLLLLLLFSCLFFVLVVVVVLLLVVVVVVVVGCYCCCCCCCCCCALSFSSPDVLCHCDCPQSSLRYATLTAGRLNVALVNGEDEDGCVETVVTTLDDEKNANLYAVYPRVNEILLFFLFHII